LKPPGTKHVKLKCDILISTFAFKFDLHRYTKVTAAGKDDASVKVKVGRCRLNT